MCYHIGLYLIIMNRADFKRTGCSAAKKRRILFETFYPQARNGFTLNIGGSSALVTSAKRMCNNAAD